VIYAFALDTGDETTTELGRFVRDNAVEAVSLTAIGAFSHVRRLKARFLWPPTAGSYGHPRRVA
jgi:predicted DNA-binding protein with PD1-like motif